jgi:hypothetical protein
MVNISKGEPFVLALTTGTIKYDKSLILPKPQHFAPSLRRPPIFRFRFRCRLVLLTPLAMRASLILTLALGAIAASATTIFPRAYPSECLIDNICSFFRSLAVAVRHRVRTRLPVTC